MSWFRVFQRIVLLYTGFDDGIEHAAFAATADSVDDSRWRVQDEVFGDGGDDRSSFIMNLLASCEDHDGNTSQNECYTMRGFVRVSCLVVFDIARQVLVHHNYT